MYSTLENFVKITSNRDVSILTTKAMLPFSKICITAACLHNGRNFPVNNMIETSDAKGE
jgi:hypothetical protein